MPHVADRVARTLGDVDRDVDVFLVRRDRHLRRLDVELEVAAVLVEAAQRLEVGRELLLRVLVVLRVPGQPARRGQRHLAAAARFSVNALAPTMLMRAIFAASPSSIVKLSATRLRSCGVTVVCTFARVEAARDVLALQLLLGAVERRAVEDARLGDADVLQRLLDRVGVEFLVADERERADRRPLLHDDDQHVALRLEAHVAEEAGRVQRLDRLRDLLVVDALADLDRQVAEDRAGLGALHAFDADVADDERLERPRRERA